MGEFINVLVSKGKSNLIQEKDNLYGQFVGEWDFEWVDNQGTTGERHVQGEWIFAWVLEGTAIQDVFICPSRKARIKDYQPDAAYATIATTFSATNGVTDSAAAGTALATGNKTKNGALGVKKDLETKVNSVASWANIGKKDFLSVLLS